jgi:hypothetical protein
MPDARHGRFQVSADPDRLDIGRGMDPITVEAEEQRVAVGIERQPLRQWPVEQPVVELHQRFAEDRRIHRFRRSDNRAKTHQRQNVALDIDAGRDLDQFEAFRDQPEHASLGDIEHRLPLLAASRPENVI